MKNCILSNWTLPRILRLLVGLVIISEAISKADVASGIVGTIFTGMGVFDIGCCSSGTCYTPMENGKEQPEDISFEEVV